MWGQNAALDRLADASTRYAIGSVSKQFTSAVLLLLQERSKLSLDDNCKRWQYSNTNYVIAGQIFEKVAGQPLVAFLREKIFSAA